MAFTYDDSLSTDRDKVRRWLGDVTENSGPLPDDSNFSDNEIAGLIDAEGTWQRAVAAGFEALASAWRRYPSFKADGLSLSRSDIADGYAEQAVEWREKYGRTKGVNVAGIIKLDGYSDDVTSDDVDTDTEYESSFEYVRLK
jgi:hypothetical protein